MHMAIAEDKSVSIEKVLAGWKERHIRNVRFELPDMHGTSRSKIVPIDHAAGYAKNGLNMYGGAAVLDSRSDVVPGTLYNEEVAYADQLLHPDPSTAAIVPWAEATARLICDGSWEDGRPLAAAPRYVFRRVLDRCHELGYEPVIGMECEFYLLDPETHKPLFSGYHIFNSVRNTWVPAIERIVDQMKEFGIDIITANCEYAGSQWEINYVPGRGMAGPDRAFSFKNGVKEIARREGLLATFMSKPFADSAEPRPPGWGQERHVRGRRGGGTVAGGTPVHSRAASPRRLYLCAAGADAELPQAAPPPHLQPLERLLGSRGSLGLRAGQGRLDREPAHRKPCPVRPVESVPGRGGPAGERAARDGRQARARAGRATAGRGGRIETEAADDARGVAIESLEADDRITELLGEEFVKAYTVMRRYELQRFADHVTDWELQEYLEIY